MRKAQTCGSGDEIQRQLKTVAWAAQKQVASKANMARSRLSQSSCV